MRLETKQEWLEYAKSNVVKLTLLLENYHPVNLADPFKKEPRLHGKITAHMAEQACADIREEIAEEQADQGNPISRFQEALNINNVEEIYSLLNNAWFGVPESSSCWDIDGFSEAVNLLEQPPEES